MDEPAVLSYAKCRELLAAGVVGRVGFLLDGAPMILPVNYAVVNEAIIFRTTEDGVLGQHALAGPLCFEVDHIDYDRHVGWSVVAVGRGGQLEAEEAVAAVKRVRDPRPWASESTRQLYVRLPWEELTGRRLGAGWTHDNELPVRRML